MSVGRRLCGALILSAKANSVIVTIEIRSVPWASGLFEGERHEIEAIGAASDQFDAWLASLPNADWSIGGHIVEDLLVAHRRREGSRFIARIEALTIVLAEA